VDLFGLTRERFDGLTSRWGLTPLYRTRLFEAVHRRRVTSLAQVEGLREEHYPLLEERARLGLLPVHTETRSAAGDTHKLLLRLADGQTIETVLMRYQGRTTVCVSSQAGCAMGCVFCATGQMGFQRHLTAGEIVAQVLHVCRILDQTGESLRNVVLMGMGEPLHNYDATLAAVDVLQEPTGLGLGARYITLSTVGVVPGIRRLADEGRPVRLAVSLHAATDAERMALVPAARKWPLAELMDACRYYSQRRRQRIFFEWALIRGRNDGPEQAHAVGALLSGLDAHLNLIPLNPTAGYAEGPSGTDTVRAFQDVLVGYGVPSTVRQRRGIDIDAGCGQLRARTERQAVAAAVSGRPG
jgi:23S rRNA (adenine2503-C2)-methyltransferase